MTFSQAVDKLMGRETRKQEYEFSANQPKVAMPIISKIERVQPFVVGINEKGEFIWEGRAMPKWQMELFRFMPNVWSEFFTRWLEVSKYEKKDQEFRAEDAELATIRAASKDRLSEMRRMYPTKKGYGRKVKGD